MRKSWGELSFFIFLDIHWRIQDIRGGGLGIGPSFLDQLIFLSGILQKFCNVQNVFVNSRSEM